MKEPCVGIVLVNYRGAEDTLECIHSLQKMEYDNFFVIVVDNHSEDKSLKMFSEKQRDFEFIVIPMAENAGFSAGNNKGINYALDNGAEYILLLNNDTLVDKWCLTKLIQVHQDIKECGISIGKIYYADEPDKLWYAGGKLDLKTGKVTQIGLGKKDRLERREREKVSFATGCCMCVKAKVFHEVGFLDESFFLYEEDTDFCNRVLKKGMEIFYEPAAVIFHKVSASTSKDKKMSPTTQYYMVRNKYIFLKRNFTWGWSRIYAYSYCLAMFLSYWLRGFMKIKYIVWGLSDFFKGTTGKSRRNL